MNYVELQCEFRWQPRQRQTTATYNCKCWEQKFTSCKPIPCITVPLGTRWLRPPGISRCATDFEFPPSEYTRFAARKAWLSFLPTSFSIMAWSNDIPTCVKSRSNMTIWRLASSAHKDELDTTRHDTTHTLLTYMIRHLRFRDVSVKGFIIGRSVTKESNKANSFKLNHGRHSLLILNFVFIIFLAIVKNKCWILIDRDTFSASLAELWKWAVAPTRRIYCNWYLLKDCPHGLQLSFENNVNMFFQTPTTPSTMRCNLVLPSRARVERM